MSYNVRCYKNTGYNAINCPDSPAKLRAFSHFDLTPTEIIQPYRLTTITVGVTSYKQIMDVDFIEIYDASEHAFYSCDSYEMTSPDVAVLGITMDYTLTLMAYSGYANLGQIPFLDGITERHHIPKSSDVFGNFGEDDPLLCPSKPLEVVTADLLNYDAVGNPHVVVESRINLSEPGEAAKTYEDPVTSEVVTVPNIDFVQTRGSIGVYDPSTNGTKNVPNPSAQYYDGENSTVKNNITRAQNLSLEGGILNSWLIPNECANVSTDAKGKITSFTGAHKEISTGLNFEYRSVNNKRALYGKTTRFILYSPASGSSAEFDAEDICKNGNSVLTAPSVVATYDCRPDGRPYYRFKYYRGNSNTFWMNSIPGQQWATAPINFTSKSGVSLDTARFKTSQEIAFQGIKNASELGNLRAQQINENVNYQNTYGTLNGVAAGLGAFTGGMRNDEVGATFGGAMSGVLGAASAGAEYGMGIYNSQMGYLQQNTADRQALEMKKMAYGQELQNFALTTQVTMPAISFPRSNTLRDIIGNGVTACRVQISQSDAQKFDKILNMYGYRVTDKLDPSFFTNRSQYNYVKAVGVSVGGTAPKWLRQGVGAELAVGKRFWHVNPDPALYEGGTNA